MLTLDRGVWRQKGIGEICPDTIIPSEKIRKKFTAVQVLGEILRVNPAITDFLVTTYCPLGSSEGFSSSQIGALKMWLTSNLSRRV